MPTIWAASTAAPGNTCADARLLGDGRMLSYPAGNFSGQAGWDIGVGFTTFTDLANNLKPGGALHPGKWAIKGTAAEWSVDDDQKGCERLMRMPLPPKKNEARGSYSADVTIKGVPHGWFEMWKQ